jgi:toxin FitB
MILMDTNVLSQTIRAYGSPCVRHWLDAQPERALYICAPVLADLYFGALHLLPGKKRDDLVEACAAIERRFEWRLPPFESRAARRYAEFRASRWSVGRAAADMDMIIAAVASVHDMTIATQNIRDFDGLGVPLVNPLDAAGRTLFRRSGFRL